jgi:SET domain-containing protein
MDPETTSYLTPKAEVRDRPEIKGNGIFATTTIKQGELILIWSGYIVDRAGLEALTAREREMTAQVSDHHYQISPLPGEPADFINHCCDPNAGMAGEITVVARRTIEAGEEICIDYAMVDGNPYDDFECRCGLPECRERVTGDDWQRPELQQAYRGYFSPYLQRRIDTLTNHR